MAGGSHNSGSASAMEGTLHTEGVAVRSKESVDEALEAAAEVLNPSDSVRRSPVILGLAPIARGLAPESRSHEFAAGCRAYEGLSVTLGCEQGQKPGRSRPVRVGGRHDQPHPAGDRDQWQ